MTVDTPEFVKRAADRIGFKRSSYVEANIPTTISNIRVVPFFGDIRSSFILSTFLLKRYKELKPTEYLILCSWPGFEALFPFVDEFWHPNDDSILKTLSMKVGSFSNSSDASVIISRNLIQHFENIMTYDDLNAYYDDGFKEKFWQNFGEIRRYLPHVLENRKIYGDLESQGFNPASKKVFIFPTTHFRSWQNGKCEYLSGNRDFWVALVERLLEENYLPVIWQNKFTFDLSTNFTNKCYYITTNNLSEILGTMRTVGLVLDIYSGISRLSISARTPFICVDERLRYINQKDYEIDDLCCFNIPKQYIFSFSTMLLTGEKLDWDNSLINGIVSKLNKFIPILDRDNWMSMQESDEFVPHEMVKERNSKRMGVLFLRSSKNN